jgi:uncharacterized OsmC-like protein
MAAIFHGGIMSSQTQITAEYVDNVRFEVCARGHRLLCDQPVHNGGDDVGLAPPEFLLASLAGCAGYYALRYLSARSIPAAGLQVRVTAEKALNPARLASFDIDITAPDLDPEHEAGLLRAVNACLIHNTLMHPPVIRTRVLSPVAA